MRTLPWLLLGLFLWLATPATTWAQDAPADPLADPVVLGAWLYEGACVRCHGAYDKARLGEDKPTKLLKAEITGEERNGCDIDWAISRGGPLTLKEIGAIVSFMEAWEEAGGALTLPPLPPQPTPTPRPALAPAAGVDAERTVKPVAPTPTPLPSDLAVALASNPVARGAWLYAQNCYRCHQDYAAARMGSTLDSDTVERTIRGGKVGSNMPAFAISDGGPLRSADIKLIVNYIEAWERLGVTPALPDAVRDTMVQPLDPVMLLPIVLPTAPLVAGNAADGALLYRAYCTVCHGNAGQGGSGPALTRVSASIRPDLTLRAAIAQGVPGTVMRGWARTHGGPFTDPDLDNIVVYLLTLTPSPTITRDAEPASTPTPSPWQGWQGAALLLGAVGAVLWRARRR
jgi:mono/diheme cytochrome c family protein